MIKINCEYYDEDSDGDCRYCMKRGGYLASCDGCEELEVDYDEDRVQS